MPHVPCLLAALVALPAAAQDAPEPIPDTAWLRPVAQVAVTGDAVSESARPYSLPVRPRNLVGALALSCEYVEGRPCGDGAGGDLAVDSAAGVGHWLLAFTRVRGVAGSGGYAADLQLDRAFLKAMLGPVDLAVGRDLVLTGPAVRAESMLGRNAAPLDHARVALRPLNLLGENGSALRLSALVLLARLRDPQYFPHSLLSVQRGELELFDRVALGFTRFLVIGGRGAPPWSLGEFLAAHIFNDHAHYIENNRLAFDVTVRRLPLVGGRVYGEMTLEDKRATIDTLKLDTDYLLGYDRAIDHAVVRRLSIEWQRTSAFSYEWGIFRSGVTNAGRILGSPLGPEGTSTWVGLELAAGPVTLRPWGEVAVLKTDRGQRQVEPPSGGVPETRLRGGSDAAIALGRDLRLEASVFGEHVESFAFVAGQTALNAGARLSLVWTGPAALSF